MQVKQLEKGAYDPKKTEPEILKFWLSEKYYKPETAREIFYKQGRSDLTKGNEQKFSLINPPPNAYARPHIGNVSGYAYQDVFARRARLQGKVTLMLPGKDHAAQQAEVVYVRDVLTPKGKKKSDFTREQFYNDAYEYFTKIMKTAQQDEQRIGLSSDFDRDLFTLDPRIEQTVMETFARMWREGMVYKGVRIVNWSPGLQSAVADIDTEREQVDSKFYYLRYKLAGRLDQSIKNIRDTFKKNKFLKGDFSEIDLLAGLEQPSKQIKKQAKRFKHLEDVVTNEELEANLDSERIKLWVNLEEAETVEDLADELEITGLVVPFSGDVQLVAGKPSEEFIEFVFKHSLRLYGSCFVRKFADDKNLPDAMVDDGYRRGFIIGTVRPETVFGDTAIAVDPKDERYGHLIGTKVRLEGAQGELELQVIANPRVETDFGSGMLKVTPAHAPTDYSMYLEHNEENPTQKIEYLNVIGKDSRLNHMAGKYAGMHVEEDREKLAEMMKNEGFIVYEEMSKSNIIICERTKTVIQPLMSSQWFIDTDKLKIPALEALREQKVRVHPENMTKKLDYWLENLRDWPISRSIWWGYRIPVWYKGKLSEETNEFGQIVVKIANKEVNSMEEAKEKGLMWLALPEEFSPILVPGRFAPENPTLYAELKEKFPAARLVETGNIDQEYQNYELQFNKINFDESSVVVAHSLGAAAIIDFILSKKIKIKSLVLLAPSNDASGMYEEYKIKGFWSEEDRMGELLDYVSEIKLIYSDNDEVYSQDNFLDFASKIGAETILEKGKKHFARINYHFSSKELERLLEKYNQEHKQAKSISTKENISSAAVQDEDVFDTWFSSGQWPYATLQATGMNSYYPTDVMETGYDILELWVSRMLMLGLYTQGEVPFKDVYLHGLIRGEDGQKMSKSRGNLVYTEDIVEEYGADALRMMYIVGNKAGASYRVDREKLKGYRNFLNKIWNLSKFILINLQALPEKYDEYFMQQLQNLEQGSPEVKEIFNELNELVDSVSGHMD
ncbi:MAG: class I tRNA ligase family protein, partial [Candidatus Dojkabacteria bacterium]